MTFTKIEQDGIEQVTKALLADDADRPGRRVICIGPHCWGRGVTPQEAIRNAKRNRAKIYEGPKGWRFVLYIADESVTVDEMGGFRYLPREDGTPAYTLVYTSPGITVPEETKA